MEKIQIIILKVLYNSYSVKLKKGQTINGFRKFKIIVDKRFEVQIKF